MNAALNILASGTGAAGRRGALVLADHSCDPSIDIVDGKGNQPSCLSFDISPWVVT